MNKNKIISKIVSVALVLCFALVGTLTAFAGHSSHGNGWVLNDQYTNGSGIIAMGDSRTVQIFHCYGNKGAAQAVWGGHYGYGNRIDATARRNAMKSTVLNELKSKGKAKVFIFATVNDCNGSTNYKTPVANQISMAKTAYSWTAKYKGKTVRPKVYCTSLIPAKGKSATNYNNYLKNQLKSNSHITYCGITPSTKSYQADGLHYTSSMAKAIWNNINGRAF